MIDEKQVIEETLLELCNRIWQLKLYVIRDEAHARKNHISLEEYPEYCSLVGNLSELERVLGNLLVKLGNSEYSLLVNRLNVTLDKKD